MRKVILNIVFLAMLLFNSWNFYAKESGVEVTQKVASTKITSDNTSKNTISESGFLLEKGDVLNEIDDNEEYNTENNPTSLKEKQSGVILSLISDCLRVCLIEKPFSDNSYTLVNFSRLPRYNHLSLRVLLI